MSGTGAEREVALTWLGQAGYAIEADGRVCLVDPYLTEYVLEVLGGPARAVPAPMDPATAHADVVVVTHWHYDHLDLPACEALAATNPELTFVGPSSIAPRLVGRGIAAERIVALEERGTVACAGFTIHGEYARHDVPGFLTEDAIALVVEAAGVRIFHSGDTEYDARCLGARRRGPFDVAILVSNGSGGCMNGREAALMAHQLAPALAIPCHYGMWEPAGYGAWSLEEDGEGPTLDPRLFADVCERLGSPATRILGHGERMVVGAAR
jgi:L-ascorbate metabolism protein UlaG (beta-lactamase superfamily)